MTQRPVSASIGDLKVTLRYETIASDLATVRDIVTSTGFFHDHEVDVAVELVEERLRRGDASGYYFAFVKSTDAPSRIRASVPSPARQAVMTSIGSLFRRVTKSMALASG